MKKVYMSLFFFGTLSSVSAQWTVPSPMFETRTQHIAVTLNSGKVLVAGGWDFTINLVSAEVYDPVTDTWISTGNDMPSAHTNGAAVKLNNGKVLVTGGYNGISNIANCDLYNPVANSWSPTGELNVGRSYHTATVLQNGKVLVTGGYNGVSNLAECELYDPSSDTWSIADSMATGRAYHTATLLGNGKVLVAGGYNPDEGYQLKTAELYDPVTDSWTSVADMDTVRSWHAASLLADGKVMVTGGEYFTGGTPYAYSGIKTAEVYDPVANTWTNVADMPAGLCYNQQITLPGKVLVMAGQASTDYGSGFVTAPGVTYLYDVSGNSWTSVPMNIDGRLQFASAKLNDDRVIVTGGNDNSVEIFDQFLSVDDTKSNTSLQVYPNPGNGRFNINTDGERMEEIAVFDLSGKNVFTQTNVNDTYAVITLTGMADGLYTVKVKTGQRLAIKRISLVN